MDSTIIEQLAEQAGAEEVGPLEEVWQVEQAFLFTPERLQRFVELVLANSSVLRSDPLR